MFVKLRGPIRQKEVYLSISLGGFELTSFPDSESAKRYVIENIRVKEVIPAEDFEESLLKTVTKAQPTDINDFLMTKVGLSKDNCPELINKIKCKL